MFVLAPRRLELHNTPPVQHHAHLVPLEVVGEHLRNEDPPPWPCLQVASGALWSGTGLGAVSWIILCIHLHVVHCPVSGCLPGDRAVHNE